MADDSLGTIFQILQGADKVAQQQSPYAPVLQGIDQLAQATNPLRQNPYTGAYIEKPGQALAAGLVNGLARGLGQHFQNGYVADQDSAASDLVKRGLAGEDISSAQMGNLNPSVFSSITNGVSIFNKQRQLEQEDQQRKMQMALQQKVAEETNPDITAAKLDFLQKASDIEQARQMGVKKAGLLAPDQLKQAFPTLTDDQVIASKGDPELASKLEQHNITNDKPLEKNVNAELQNLQDAKDLVNQSLPLIKKVTNIAKKNPTLTLAELGSSGFLPLSDIALLKSQIPSITASLQTIKPTGGGRLPLSEFKAIEDALSGTAPLAQGVTLDRIQNLFNNRANAVKTTVKLASELPTTSRAAKAALDTYADTFSPFESNDAPESTLEDLLAEKARRQSGR